jgi:DNA processing protein
LECGGRTVAVLGWGIDWKVSRIDKKLYRDILDNRGVILSEYEGGWEAERWMFVERNRIVVGLSRAVIVVEGAIKSGSLVTAEIARRVGRKVLAVPGPITSSVSGGTNLLIKKGLATAVLDDDDLVRELSLEVAIEKRAMGDGVVLRALENEAMSVDVLAKVLGKRVEELLVTLSALELSGLIEFRGGMVSRRQGSV